MMIAVVAPTILAVVASTTAPVIVVVAPQAVVQIELAIVKVIDLETTDDNDDYPKRRNHCMLYLSHHHE